MSSGKLRGVLKFAIENFGPILVFYPVNHYYGLKPAIVASVVFSICEVFYMIRKGQKLTGLFLYSAIVTLVFGAVDLYATQSFLFKYEAAVTNVLTGLFFASSVFGGKSVIQEYVETSQPEKQLTRAHFAYFRLLTWVWVVYFFTKAAAYTWIAGRFTIEQGLLIRTLLGSGTFYVMLVLSIYGSKRIFPALKSWGLLPAA